MRRIDIPLRSTIMTILLFEWRFSWAAEGSWWCTYEGISLVVLYSLLHWKVPLQMFCLNSWVSITLRNVQNLNSALKNINGNAWILTNLSNIAKIGNILLEILDKEYCRYWILSNQPLMRPQLYQQVQVLNISFFQQSLARWDFIRITELVPQTPFNDNANIIVTFILWKTVKRTSLLRCTVWYVGLPVIFFCSLKIKNLFLYLSVCALITSML